MSREQPEISLDTRLEISREAMAREVGEDTVILDLASGAYFGLDAVGTFIWQLLRQGQAPRQICAAVEAEFDVLHDEAKRDLLALLIELRDAGLVTVAAE